MRPSSSPNQLGLALSSPWLIARGMHPIISTSGGVPPGPMQVPVGDIAVNDRSLLARTWHLLAGAEVFLQGTLLVRSKRLAIRSPERARSW